MAISFHVIEDIQFIISTIWFDFIHCNKISFTWFKFTHMIVSISSICLLNIHESSHLTICRFFISVSSYSFSILRIGFSSCLSFSSMSFSLGISSMSSRYALSHGPICIHVVPTSHPCLSSLPNSNIPLSFVNPSYLISTIHRRFYMCSLLGFIQFIIFMEVQCEISSIYSLWRWVLFSSICLTFHPQFGLHSNYKRFFFSSVPPKLCSQE